MNIEEKIKLYEIMIQTIMSAENRRYKYTTIYILIISSIYTIYGTIGFKKDILLFLITLVISILWLLTIIFFRNLSKAKWAVIKDMERDLEICIFIKEYQIHKAELKLLKVFNLTIIEAIIPSVIIIVSSIFLFKELILLLHEK